MAPKLELAFTMRSYVSLEQNVTIGAAKGSLNRFFSPITHGYIKGSGLDAKVITGGADAALVDPATNASHLDVRACARTADGESVYINYVGVLKIDEMLGNLLMGQNGRTTDFGDHEWFTSLRMEASSEALKWVETTLFIGRGRGIVEGDEIGVEYEIYKVVN